MGLGVKGCSSPEPDKHRHHNKEVDLCQDKLIPVAESRGLAPHPASGTQSLSDPASDFTSLLSAQN